MSIKLHGIHSPFVFDLYNSVFNHKGKFYAFDRIENQRRAFEQNSGVINVYDLGAGSKISKKKTRSISSIARNSSKHPKYCELLFKLVNHFQPENIIELGTSLGLTTSYLASAKSSASVATFEGCPETAALARENFKKQDLENIRIIEGNIDSTLPNFLQNINKVDFAFFDGNHKYEPTIRYFKQCLEKKTESSIFVFDDIYWSAEMEEAWKEIIAHPEVTASIDLFDIGIVFFRKEQLKQRFYIAI